MSVSDVFFALVAVLAAGCFCALITLQVLEDKYYRDPTSPFGGNIWPVVSQTTR